MRATQCAWRQPALRIEPLESRCLLALSVHTEDFDPTRILVRFDETQPVSRAATVLQKGLNWGDWLPLVRGLREVRLDSGVTIETALNSVRMLPGIVYAEPDYRLSAERTPNDPSFGTLWGLHNSGQSGGTNDADIDATEAWDTTTGSGSFVVGVIDTGIDYTHPDLAANVWTNPGEVAGNGIDDDGNGYVDDIHGYDFANDDADPMDDHGHGTHVAGTIAAVGNNGLGVVGVNWNAKVAALKFMDASGSGYTSDAVRALDYAVSKGIRITNNSWGGGGDSSSLRAAIQRAEAAGSIFVAAAGNDASNNDTTASYPSNYSFSNVVAVAATDRNDRLASFSNYGSTTVDLAAPGVSILSTVPSGGYATYSGTSMATPHVAGALALVWDRNPTWTYQQVIAQVLNSVDPVANLAGIVATGGRLNVARALGAAAPGDTTGPRVVSVSPATVATGSISRVTLTFNEPILASSFTKADVVRFSSPSGANLLSRVSSVTGSGTTWTVNFTAQSAVGTYTLVVGPDVTDLSGNKMNQDGDTTNGEATQDRHTLTFGVQAAPRPVSYSTTPRLNLPDLATTTSSMVVASTSTISDLNVTLSLKHTYDGDLLLRLIGPDGTSAVLVNRRGGSGDNFTTTTFDDEAATSIVNGRAPFRGSFRPEQSLSAFDGKSAAGTWRLEIQDLARSDIGSLTSWTLTVTPAVASSTATSRGAPTGTVAPITRDDDSGSSTSTSPTSTAAQIATIDQLFGR